MTAPPIGSEENFIQSSLPPPPPLNRSHTFTQRERESEKERKRVFTIILTALSRGAYDPFSPRYENLLRGRKQSINATEIAPLH